MENEMRTDPQVNFRINQEILERLKRSAEASGRSITAEMNFQLDRLVHQSTPSVQFKLRLPSKLHNMLQDASVAENRSITAEIVYRLQESFE